MNTIDLKTPRGYTATISTELTYRQYTEIQNVFASKMMVEAKTNSLRDVNGSVIQEANQKAASLLLLKLVGPEGEELAEPANAMMDLPFADGKAIADKINEIWAGIAGDEKKGI